MRRCLGPASLTRVDGDPGDCPLQKIHLAPPWAGRPGAKIKFDGPGPRLGREERAWISTCSTPPSAAGKPGPTVGMLHSTSAAKGWDRRAIKGVRAWPVSGCRGLQLRAFRTPPCPNTPACRPETLYTSLRRPQPGDSARSMPRADVWLCPSRERGLPHAADGGDGRAGVRRSPPGSAEPADVIEGRRQRIPWSTSTTSLRSPTGFVARALSFPLPRWKAMFRRGLRPGTIVLGVGTRPRVFEQALFTTIERIVRARPPWLQRPSRLLV